MKPVEFPVKPEEILQLFVESQTSELFCIQLHIDLLFVGYNDYIVILRRTDQGHFDYEHIISVKYNNEDQASISSFIVDDQQLWISSANILSIYDISDDKKTYGLLMKTAFDDENDTCESMIAVNGFIWCGSTYGKLYVFRTDNYDLSKSFDGHHDKIRSLCIMTDKYLCSGSSSNDTSIAIWKIQSETKCSSLLTSSRPTTHRRSTLRILQNFL
ncbi:unnamed protein product [Didymodactylos carnosus]|uniref:Uncharacterized protein n=1 Tax=Didymodactylos carnosus TaxID=1234261 RepID=A0A814B5B9_9BILA|nr:unnamed protein product [Didymodactylos carnosus]CAF1000068.1 unnamed protein product [Didymodactylos carnosus]CAF3703357.1 unnamed protein product [Didymodactylos carnosus]CAF3769562.1 unnamed protein product [Didymodactylos carnosus]